MFYGCGSDVREKERGIGRSVDVIESYTVEAAGLRVSKMLRRLRRYWDSFTASDLAQSCSPALYVMADQEALGLNVPVQFQVAHARLHLAFSVLIAGHLTGFPEATAVLQAPNHHAKKNPKKQKVPPVFV